MMGIIIAAVFLSLTILFLSILSSYQKKANSEESQIRRRLNNLQTDGKEKKADISFIMRDDQLSRIPLLNQFLKKLEISNNLSLLLEQAGATIKVGQLILIMSLCAASGFLVLLQIAGFAISAPAALLLALAPLLYIKVLKSRRIQAFTREFPDAIDMMTGALKAGHAFNKAMQLVALEAPDPIGIEFRKTFEEQNLGIPLFEALENMAQRIDSADLKLFVTAVLLQRETGGNLTEILSKIGYTIRERFKLMGQIKAFTAQGRLSGFVVGLLPVGLLGFISVINPAYTKPLFMENTGRMLLGFAVVLELVGFFFIRKIIRIKLS